ncbi:hypothetical protein POTOM_029597 [Populus tomentosa]|uniref:Strawberry notch AAA domain-containing protein n=1 Tax=Populus tomentosa TaxID=118781 RepID=A0A8X7ZAC1_POPTO|nr:hypothetical protein POTOM_029597 [Populus tomentosa]
MTQPLATPPPASQPTPQPHPAGGSVQVRCAGCRMILTVGPGITEFVCPSCKMPQMPPPELMKKAMAPPLLNNNNMLHKMTSQSQPQMPAYGIDPSKMQLPCAYCKAILNVPHGLARFQCPQCFVDLAVDLVTSEVLGKLMACSGPLLLNSNIENSSFQDLPYKVAIEVEREEDEGGTAGETFTDYRPPKLSIGPPHPDPIVEMSSLSAVQPPELTYDLKIKDDLESTKALSCLQIETLVYACQRHMQHLPNGARAGFFIGDGAGMGKGRTIAGLIWENWRHARRKALWISVGSDLKFDARRDLDDVGAAHIEDWEGSASGMFKIVRPAVGESGNAPGRVEKQIRKLLSLDKARSGWEDEYEVSSKQCMHGPNCRLGNFCTVGRRRQEVNVLGGLILPVWGTIEKALSKQATKGFLMIF